MFKYESTKTEDKGRPFYVKKIKKITFLGIPLFRSTERYLEAGYLKNEIAKTTMRLINISQLHIKTFAKFKNIHEGKDVVLVGAGPTVNSYNPIPGAIHVGCNRAFLLSKVNFNYLFTCDKIGIQDFYEEFKNYNNDCVKFIGDLNCGDAFQIPYSFALSTNSLNYKTTNGIFHPSEFALDLESQPLGSFHTVSLQAAQFILFTNPKRIYLVGIDCGNQGKHFSGKEHDVAHRGEDIDSLQQIQISEWKKFKTFAETYYPDTEIISVNPVGLKGVFKDI